MASLEIPKRPRKLSALSPNLMNKKAFAYFSERFQPVTKMPETMWKPGNVTYESDTFNLTSTNIESNIHRIHDVFMTKIKYLASVKDELDLNYKLAAKNYDMDKMDNAISATMRS